MQSGTEWEQLKARVAEVSETRENLEKRLAANGEDPELNLQMARACVRDGKFSDALRYYDTAEFLGHDEAYTERRTVALHTADAPDSNANIA